jgi:WD40 repeat protein
MPDGVRSLACVTYSPDGKTLAAQALSGTGRYRAIVLWDATTEVEQATFRACQFEIDLLAFSPDGKTLAGSEKVGSVHVWDAASGKELWTHSEEHNPIVALAFLDGGKTLAVAYRDGTVQLWDWPRPDAAGK